MQRLKQAPNGEIYLSESETQRACVRWFRAIYKPFGLLLFSIPNGGKYGGKLSKTGHSIQASIMVGEGLTEGVADLFLAIPSCGLHGLFIEMKTPIGTWEKPQKEFAQRQLEQGYGYVLCRRRKDFETAIETYLSGSYVQIQFDKINETEAKKGRVKAVTNVPA